MKQTTPKTALLVFGMIILTHIVAFTGWEIKSARTATANWFRVKKQGTVSCGPAGSILTIHFFYQKTGESGLINDHEPMSHGQPPGKDSSNGCSHQQGGAGALCETAGLKRRFLKVYHC
jgi:hypothetical protein